MIGLTEMVASFAGAIIFLSKGASMEQQIVQFELSQLVPYENNAKQHTDEQIKAVMNSIRTCGFRMPIYAWHNPDGLAEIVAGHGRALAAQRLNMETVPVVFVDDLTDEKRRLLANVDNLTTTMTGYDNDLLAYEADTLTDFFGDLTAYGFDAALDDYVQELETDDDQPTKYKLQFVFDNKKDFDACKNELTEIAEKHGAVASVAMV